MSGKVIDRTGMVFGDLTIIEKSKEERTATNKTLNVYWKCLCRCGVICEYRYSVLSRGTVKSCGCQGEDYKPNWPQVERAIREFYIRNKKRARQRGFSEYPEFEEWKEMISKPCAICGKLPETKIRKGRKGKELKIDCNQIDRIKNNLGYVLGNMQSCCEMCNFGKLDWTQEEYIKHCISVANYNK